MLSYSLAEIPDELALEVAADFNLLFQKVANLGKNGQRQILANVKRSERRGRLLGRPLVFPNTHGLRQLRALEHQRFRADVERIRTHIDLDVFVAIIVRDQASIFRLAQRIHPIERLAR